MVDTQQFIEATNFLKFNKKIKYKDLADKLGVQYYLIDNIRRGQTSPSKEIIERLVETFPETKRFFVRNYEKPQFENSRVEESAFVYNDSRAWKELAEERKKLIDRIEDENIKLKKENEQLRGENKALKEIISKR